MKESEKRLLKIIELFNNASRRNQEAMKDMDFFKEVAQKEFNVNIANDRSVN